MVAGLAEGGKVVRAIVQTPQHQGGLQGNGGKGIDGQADRVSVWIDGGDDGDTGGKAAKRVAQGTGIGDWLGHLESLRKKGRIIPTPGTYVEMKFA